MLPTARRRIWREKLNEGLSLEDIEIICYDFQLDIDNLAGNTKIAKIVSLLETLEERKLLNQLQAYFAESDSYSHIQLPGSNVTLPESPYRGLFAFREIDSDNFFGRDLFIEQVIRTMGQQPFVPLVGPSGSGKSSLVFAGVIPRIRHNPHWLITDFRPGNEPLLNLVGDLVTLLEPEMSTVDRRMEITKIETLLREEKLGLPVLVRDLLEKRESVKNLLLIVDQFEEIFTHNPEREEQAYFLKHLLSLLPSAENDSQVIILLTMRADFMGDALSHNILADVLNQYPDVKLRPMNKSEMKQVIVMPALNAGTTYEPGLVDRILDDVGNEPGKLPLLQFVLNEMWEMQEEYAMTHTSYELLGEVSGSLANYADSVYDSLSAEEKEMAPRIFTQLVQPGRGSADTRRLALREEFDEGTRPLIEELADARLVVIGRDGVGNETIELAHEALIGTWANLKQWMDADRTFREWQEELRADVRQWDQRGQDEDMLLRGAALEEAREWYEERKENLTNKDIEFIEAGLQLARDEERVTRIRWIAAIAAAALIGILGLSSLSFLGTARTQARLAGDRADQLATSEANAQLAATLAIQSQGTSEAREVEAVNARATAALALEISEKNAAQAIAAQATSEADRAAAVSSQLTADASALDAQMARSTAEADRDEANRARIEAQEAGEAAVIAQQTAVAAQIESEVQRQSAQAQALSAESRIERDNNPMRSLLLAIEAGKAGDTVQAYNALNLTLPIVGQPTNALIDPFQLDRPPEWFRLTDLSQFILQDDGALSLIEYPSQEELLRFELLLDGETLTQFSNVAVSPDGSRLFASYERRFSEDGLNAAVVWDIASGTQFPVFQSANRIENGVWDNAGQNLLIWNSQDVIDLYDPETGNIRLTIPESNIRGAAWNAAGTQFVTWHNEERTGRVVVWDALSGISIFDPISINRNIIEAAFSPAGTHLLVRTPSDLLLIDLNLPVGSNINALDIVANPSGIAWSPSGDRFVFWGEESLLRVWNGSGGAALFSLPHLGTVSGATWNVDGSQLLTWSQDGTARVWDMETGLQVNLFQHFDLVNGASWNRDESLVLTWSDDETVRVWDVTTDNQILVLTHEDAIEHAVWSEDETLILTQAQNENVRIWETASSYPLLNENISERIRGAIWNAAEDKILNWDRVGRIEIRDSLSGEIEQVVEHNPNAVSELQGVLWSQDERQILSWGLDGVLQISDVESGAVVASINQDTKARGASWSEDNERVLFWGDGFISIWEPAAGRIVLQLPHDGLGGAKWNRDESRILSFAADGSVLIWEDGVSVPIHRFDHGGKVWGAVWDSNEERIVTWGEGRNDEHPIIFWDIESSTALFRLINDEVVRGVELAADEDRLISWGNGRLKQILIWEITGEIDQTTEDVQTRLEHDRTIVGANWTEDDLGILSWSWDETARIWDAATGGLTYSISGDGELVLDARLNGDEDKLLITTFDGTARDSGIRIYDTNIEDLVDLGCGLATRNFTWDEWRRYGSGDAYTKTCGRLPVDCSVPEVFWPAEFVLEQSICSN